jgi:hypothetical protein
VFWVLHFAYEYGSNEYSPEIVGAIHSVFS